MLGVCWRIISRVGIIIGFFVAVLVKIPRGGILDTVQIVAVEAGDLSVQGIGCVANSRHIGYLPKLDWVRKRLSEGMKIYLLKQGKSVRGILEFIPGEFAWRAVKAPGYLFIHCLWIYSKDLMAGGYGSQLVKKCVEDARSQKKLGVAVLTSSGPWMADSRVYVQNGFKQVSAPDRFELLVRQFNPGPLPEICDWTKSLRQLQGWHLVYAEQCPMLVKSVYDLQEAAREHGINLQVRRLETAREAQAAPSLYSVFSLVRDGRLLADHYVSRTRFQNIVRKELEQGAIP